VDAVGACSERHIDAVVDDERDGMQRQHPLEHARFGEQAPGIAALVAQLDQRRPALDHRLRQLRQALAGNLGIEQRVKAHVGHCGIPGIVAFSPTNRASEVKSPRPVTGVPRLISRMMLARATAFCSIAAHLAHAVAAPHEAVMVPFFVQIKCQLGKSYQVANKLADAEIASEIYSTAGDFDLLVKFYVEDGTDIGHFVNEKVQTVPGILDTRTIITFKAF
jgi:DNA-binding Lrp family transcriptional regulator